MSIPTDPTKLAWTFCEIPPIESVPADCAIVVWDVPTNTFGLLCPWGNELNATHWQHRSCHGCLDGVWNEQRGEPIVNSKGQWDYSPVQSRGIRKPVWWAWVKTGTPGKKHEHPTWRELHGPCPERDWA